MYVSLYLCMSLCLYIWSSVYLSGDHKIAACNCVQLMWPQAMGSNPLSFSIICQSVCPIVHGFLAIFLFLFNGFNTREMINITNTITSVGLHISDPFIPTLGSGGPQWGLFELICPFLCLYVSLSLCLAGFPSRFLAIIFAVHKCAQCMRMQAPGTNRLSGSIICPYICPSGRSRDFCDFCIYINFHCGGPVSRCIYPHTGAWRIPEGSSPYYMPLSLYLCLFVYLSGGLSASFFGENLCGL